MLGSINGHSVLWPFYRISNSGDGLLNTSNFYLHLDSFLCNSPPHAVVNAGNLAVSGRDQKVTAIHKHRLASN